MGENAGIWLRVSTTDQSEASQEPDVLAWAKARKYAVARTYRLHGESAWHGEQEQYQQQVLADMHAGIITVLVAWVGDRVERRGVEALLRFMRECREAGGRLECSNDPLVNSAEHIGDLGPSLAAWIAEQESRRKSDRIKLKHNALRAAGSWAVGIAAYGYRIVSLGDGRKTLEADPDQAAVVLRIFQQAADGISIGRIAKSLTADGVKPARGDFWNERTISKLIANVVYRGLVQHNGTTYAEVEPLVPSALWLAANQSVKSRLKRPGRDGGRPLGALLRPICGRCGGALYRYGTRYRCAGVGPSGNSTQRVGCGVTIGIKELDEQVLAEFLGAEDVYVEETIEAGSDYAEEIAGVTLKLKDLDLDAEDYDFQHAKLRQELKRLKALPVLPPKVVATPVFDEYGGLMTEGDAFKAMDLDEQKAFIRLWELRVYPAGTEPRWDLQRGHGSPERPPRA